MIMAEWLMVVEWIKRIDLGRTAILLGFLGAIGIVIWEIWRATRKRD